MMRIFINRLFLVVAIFTANNAVSANSPIELSCVLSSGSDGYHSKAQNFGAELKQIHEKIHIVIEMNVWDKRLPEPEKQISVEMYAESSDSKMVLTGSMSDTKVVAARVGGPADDMLGGISSEMIEINRRSGDITWTSLWETKGKTSDKYKYGVCKKSVAPVF